MSAITKQFIGEIFDEQRAYVLGNYDKLIRDLQGFEALRILPFSHEVYQESCEYFIIYMVGHLSKVAVLDLATELAKLNSLLVRKIVYFDEEASLDSQLISLLHELRVDYVANGEARTTGLIQYLQKCRGEAEQVGSLASYKKEIHAAHMRGDHKALFKLASRVEAVGEESDDKVWLVAHGYLWAGKAELAIAVLNRFLAQNPFSLWAVEMLASLYLSCGKIDYGVELLERLGTFQRLSPQRFYRLGETYERARLYRPALSAYLQGYKLSRGKNCRFQEGLVRVYAALGSYDKALSYTKGLELSWNCVKLLCEHSLTAMRRQDYWQQVKLLQAVLPSSARKPVLAATLKYNLALAFISLQNLQKAWSYLQGYELGDKEGDPLVLQLAQLLRKWAETGKKNPVLEAELTSQVRQKFRPLKLAD